MLNLEAIRQRNKARSQPTRDQFKVMLDKELISRVKAAADYCGMTYSDLVATMILNTLPKIETDARRAAKRG